MAKKTIISDFGALKGKVTFTEPADVPANSKKTAGPASAQTPAQQPAQSKENHLKVGQSVVLIDSDHRGKIVSLGKRVQIELEDGLVIEASYGEFAVTDHTELEALKSSKVKHHKKVSPSSTASPGSLHQKQKPAKGILEIDLHIEALPGGNQIPKGQQLQYQMDTFNRVIRDHLPHKGLKISFIHGVGDGILKAAIRKELDEVLALRCSYSVGDPAVTIVTIR